MFTTIDAFEAEALSLPAIDRVRLVAKLIASLDADPEIEAAWISEIAQREAAIECGEASWLDGAATLAKLKAEFSCPPSANH
jgi:Putative addiction module component